MCAYKFYQKNEKHVCLMTFENGKHYKEMSTLEKELYDIHFAVKEKERIFKLEENARKKRVKKICLYKIRKKILDKSSF